MNKLVAVAKLTRVEHSVMLILAVIAAELLVGGIPLWYVFALSLLTPALISMGAFAINDYFDVETDRANKRTSRPLVSGALNRREAYNIALFCLAAGALLSLFINIAAFLIAAVFAALAYLYSYKLKDMFFVGNAYVAFAMVIPFLYGDYVVSNLLAFSIILISLIVFFSGLAREIHGTVRDAAGDSKVRRSKNVVHYLGDRRAAIIALTLYAWAILISILMFGFVYPFRLNLVYIVPVTLANLLFLYVGIGYVMMPNRKFYDLSRNLSLAGMAIAILAFLFSAVFVVYI